MRLGHVVLIALTAACGPEDSGCIVREGVARCAGLPDAYDLDVPGPCNPLTQAGCAAAEKCTWILDSLMPSYAGHVGCAPDGTANVGEACMFDTPQTTGVDNCKAGGACSLDDRSGSCESICALGGGAPQCTGFEVCKAHPRIFASAGSATVGLCEPP